MRSGSSALGSSIVNAGWGNENTMGASGPRHAVDLAEHPVQVRRPRPGRTALNTASTVSAPRNASAARSASCSSMRTPSCSASRRASSSRSGDGSTAITFAPCGRTRRRPVRCRTRGRAAAGPRSARAAAARPRSGRSAPYRTVGRRSVAGVGDRRGEPCQVGGAGSAWRAAVGRHVGFRHARILARNCGGRRDWNRAAVPVGSPTGVSRGRTAGALGDAR